MAQEAPSQNEKHESMQTSPQGKKINLKRQTAGEHADNQTV
jgi:hypothetical protein